jgi:hypothetical protein
MIGVNVAVTFGASSFRAIAHVVWGVAARALLMARGVSAAQDGKILVARAARGRLVFGELVRTMATHALPMAGVEQRSCCDDRRLLGVTRHARPERFRCRGVLLLVACRAGLGDGLAGRGVRCSHFFVAVVAGCRHWLGIFVRSMAVEALLRVVNLHGRRRALGGQVAMRAVAGRVSVRVQCQAAR